MMQVNSNRLIVALVGYCLTFALSARAADPADSLHPKRIYPASRATHAPVIDGSLADDCWQSGEWQSNYTQFTPVYRGTASVKTAIKILYNDKSVFVAIRAYDDMKKITRRLGRRDSFSGDIVGVQFDSYFDHRTAFEFDLTAAGQKIDVLVMNDGWDVNWNAVWNGKVGYEDSAWTAEMEIPLSQLRYGSAPEQVWGLNSWRFISRTQEENHWNLVANDGTGLVYTFGELHGINGLKRNSRMEVAPYVLGKLTTDKAIPGNPFATGSSFSARGGVDAKMGVSNNFTLDATINPDFGQIEADPSVMNLTAFETYFEEKRPFFTEGKNIFDFTFDADQLFYSRRIGHRPSFTPGFDTISVPEFTPIAGAFKLSGKTARGLSLGFIESVTPREMARIHDQARDFKQVAEPASNYFIGRFQKDYNKGNTIVGGILTYTHRFIHEQYLDFLSRNALTYGLEFTRYWKDRTYFFQVKTIGSQINGKEESIQRLQASSARFYQRPDIRGISFDSSRTSLGGFGSSLKIGKWSKGHWRYSEEFILRSGGLELNDLGYMTLSNLVKNNLSLSYVEKKNTKTFKNYTITAQQQSAWDAHGQSLYAQASLNLQAEFMNNWIVLLTGQHRFHITDEWLLRGGPAMRVPNLTAYTASVQSSFSKKVFFSLAGSYNHGGSGNLRFLSLSGDVTYRPKPNLALSLQPNYLQNVDALQYVSEVIKLPSGHEYLLGRVDNRNLGLAFRIDYAITPELTVQYYGSPFVAIGRYSEFKEVVRPVDAVYTNRFRLLTPQQTGSTYYFDDNNDGFTDFSVGKPDFNYQQFRSNLVLRWEYLTGSTLYLVWSQDRTAYVPGGEFDFGTGYHDLFGRYPRNVFMVKCSYLLRK